jgi:molybdopterin-guanine dinucleotide biosynthesis protein A
VITAGIFVGGKARRMGGAPKGLLRVADGQTILARTLELLREVEASVVLVGRSEAYASGLPSIGPRADSTGTLSAFERIGDAEDEAGPLAGLVALLEHAGTGPVLALACDMPYLTAALVRRVASHSPDAAALAPRRDGRWEPLFARYDAARVRPFARGRLARRELSLQGLLDEVGAEELPLQPAEVELLCDWDSPSDIR